MEILNYDQESTNLIKESEEFEKQNRVHPSRLLKARSYHAVDALIYDHEMIDVQALLMATRANHLLFRMDINLEKQAVAYVKDKVLKVDGIDLGEMEDPAKVLSSIDREHISGIRGTSAFYKQSIAYIHAYIVKHHPEEVNIIQNDRTRFNPYCWVDYLEQTDQDPLKFGFDWAEEVNDWIWMGETFEQEFEVEKVKLRKDHFLEHVHAVRHNTDKINYGIDKGVTLINYINYKLCEFEVEVGYEGDGGEIYNVMASLAEPQSDDDGRWVPVVINRYNNALYRDAKYTLETKDLPKYDKSGYYPLDTNKSLHILKFIQEWCHSLPDHLDDALGYFEKNKQSIMYQNKDFERWMMIALGRQAFKNHRKTVWRWYQRRVFVISDEKCEESLKYLIKHYESFQISQAESDEFIADQTLVKKCLRNKKPLPSTKDLGKLDFKQLTPILKNYGLKIVPIEKEEKEVPQAPVNVAATTVPGSWEDLINRKIDLSLINKPISQNVLQDFSKFFQMPKIRGGLGIKTNTKSKAKKQDETPLKTEAFESGYNFESLKKKYENDDTYKRYLKDLGGAAQCVGSDIFKAKHASVKSVYTRDEEDALLSGRMQKDPNKVKIQTAQSWGNNFCKENGIEPCHGGTDPLTRFQAMSKMIQIAYNKVHRPKIMKKASQDDVDKALEKDPKSKLQVGDLYELRQPNLNSDEMRKAKGAFDEEAKSLTGGNLETVFLKHLKKIVGRKKGSTDVWVKQVNEIEGKVGIKKGCKFDTVTVALVMRENHVGN